VNQVVDEIKNVEVKLYFPLAMVLSEGQYDKILCKRILCAVEISAYGSRGPNAGLREQGIVRGMRIITIIDPSTRQWITFEPTNRNTLAVLQRALSDAVMEKLELRPPRPSHTTIAPKEVLLGT